VATRQRDLVRVCAVLAALAVLALALSACAPGPGRDYPDAAGLHLTLPRGVVGLCAPLTASDGGRLVATPYDVAA
jgi:hypothetical protein